MTVKALSTLKAKHATIAGSKAANLGELISAGADVPVGYVVTADSYIDFLQVSGLQTTIDKFLTHLNPNDQQRINVVCGRLRQIISATPWPDKFQKDIKKVTTFSSELLYAVRSSAIGEDSEETSFAGQHSTYLGVPSDQIARRIKDCFASLFEPRAVAYRLKNNLSLQDAKMAVVVQEMVAPQTSGVMFTKDPNTGEDTTIIEAVYGVGEALVSGAVTPSHYEISNGNVVSTETNQEKSLTVDNKWKKIPSIYQTNPKLTPLQIDSLQTMGKILENHFKSPLDIEWCWKQDSHFPHILQARPITTTSAKNKDNELDLPVVVKGFPASYGQGTGPVKVIMDVKDLDKVEEGDILVTSMTTPDFVPVFNKIAGVVTDFGGSTCHAAIISREYGLPCVVGTGGATAKLMNQQTVIVDGGWGLVYQTL